MKKSRWIAIISLSAAMVFFAFCLNTSLVRASNIRGNCGVCGSPYVQSGQFMNDWYTYHQIHDNHGNYATCAIYHYVERITSYCPNGHGVEYTEDRQTDVHTNSACPLH